MRSGPILALLPCVLLAQPAGDKTAAIKQSIAQNQAALKQYRWTETTQVSLKGEVKKTEQKQCSYGPDGKVQKIPLGAPAPPPPPKGGRVRQKIVKEKVDEMKDYMDRAGALIHQYVPPEPAKLQAAAAAGRLSIQPNPSAGATTYAFQDYLKAGDSFSVAFNQAAKSIQSCAVQWNQLSSDVRSRCEGQADSGEGHELGLQEGRAVIR
jgi:hypothetical protein